MKVPDLPKKPEYDKIGKGQYQLHVLIESTSALSLVSDSSIDVRVAVTAFGKTEWTKVKSKIGVEETFWGEHFYFTRIFDSVSNGENQRLLIQVYDYSQILANTLVGSYQFDVQRIYSYKNHTLEHTWLALSNNESNFSQIAGYIKISASLLGQKDQNIQLQVQPISSITKQKTILAPPQIERKIYQVTVQIIEGKYIKPADGTSVDSYIGVQFGQIFSVSETIVKDTSPKYNTRVYLPVSLPAAVQNIALRLHDYNYIQKTQVLGSYYININQLIKSLDFNFNLVNLKEPKPIQFNQKPPLKQFQWVNFYGPQNKTKREDQKNIQQFFPNAAPYYVGSVLMRASVVQTTTVVQTKKESINREQIAQAMQILRSPVKFFKIKARITAALGLYYKNKKHRVSIRIGAQEFFTFECLAKNGFCLWNIQKIYTFRINSYQTIPDIFVYLLDQNNERICYKRYKPALGQVQEDRWQKLTPDFAMIQMNKSEAGYLKIGLNLEPTDKLQQLKDVKIKNNPLGFSYMSNKNTGRIVVDLLCGSELIPLDDDGSIDSFFNFSYLNSQVVSPVMNDTINPNFYKRLIIQTDVLNQEDSPPIIVRAYDKDNLSNEFLGQAFIDIGDAIKNKSLVYGTNGTPQAAWYQLYQDDIVTGKFLCMFTMLPNFVSSIPPSIYIQPKNFQLTLVILGLRGLKNSGYISVKQPFIQFDLGGLDFQNRLTKQIRENKMIRTEPMQKGRSVNINSVIPSKLFLPSNVNYWPTLTAKVRDNVIGKIYQPILGYFSINLYKSYVRSAEMKQKFQNERRNLKKNKQKIIIRPPRLANINQKLLLSLRSFIIKSINYNWKVMDGSIQKKLNSSRLKPKSPIDEEYVVVFPKYEKQVQGSQKSTKDLVERFRYLQKHKDIIERNGQYTEIGYDDTKSRGAAIFKRNKHYRYTLNQSFESYYQRTYGVKMGIMQQIPIRIGSRFLTNDLVSSVLRKVSKDDMVSGTFKGQVFITQFNDRAYSQENQMKNSYKELMQLLLKKGKVYMYLYVIEAANLVQKDQFSASDSYLVVKAGEQVQQFKNQHIENESNPQYFKKIVMPLSFPQDSSIDIQIWDYDPVGADELIGSCTIDIQNRIQANLKSTKFNNPIETHNIYHTSSKRPQGLIRFWLDLVPVQNVSLYREFNISRKPKTNYEMRVIVWEVRDMPNNDIEDMSDLYVQGSFNQVVQSTDVHYRSSSGAGRFNWRMIFPFTMPIKDYTLTLKVFDKDMITQNDFLASSQLNLYEQINEAYETDSSITLYLGQKDYAAQSDVKTGKKKVINGFSRYDRFQLLAYNKLNEQQGGSLNKLNKQGYIQISVQILNQSEAKKRPAGKGRQNPNQHPHLPEPKGRFQLSMNPASILTQTFGPKCKKYSCLIICAVVCVIVVFYLFLPFLSSFAGSAVARVVSK